MCIGVVVSEEYKTHWASLYPQKFSWMFAFLIQKLYAIFTTKKLPAVTYITKKDVNQNDLNI